MKYRENKIKNENYNMISNNLYRDIYKICKNIGFYEGSFLSVLKKYGIDKGNMTNIDVSKYDYDVIISLLIATTRAERFCADSWNYYLENGCILKWLLRLKELE